MSVWISASDFSAGVSPSSGDEFSLSVVDFDFFDLLLSLPKMFTYCSLAAPSLFPLYNLNYESARRLMREPYVELPPLDMLSGLLACDDYHEFRDLGFLHPFAQLTHYLLDVCFYLVIDRCHHRESIFLNSETNQHASHRIKAAFYSRHTLRNLLADIHLVERELC